MPEELDGSLMPPATIESPDFVTECWTEPLFASFNSCNV
jgi:hypothetical protein